MSTILTHDGVTYHRPVSLAEAVAYARQQLAAADREMVRHNKIYAKCKCGLAWVCPEYVAAVGDVNLWAGRLERLPACGAAWAEPAPAGVDVVNEEEREDLARRAIRATDPYYGLPIPPPRLTAEQLRVQTEQEPAATDAVQERQ